jgi:hypothetical protein
VAINLRWCSTRSLQQEAPGFGIAYRLQERALGGLTPSVLHQLEHASDDACARRVLQTRPVTKASKDTVLIRERRRPKPPGHYTRARSSLPQRALPFALAGGSRDHRHQLVRATLFRSEEARKGELQCWNALSHRFNVVRCTPGSLPRRGLEQDFNSLHAQREAGEAYVASQAGEGWRLVETAYDDGGRRAIRTGRSEP